MQHKSFSLGCCNYSNRDCTTDARTGWSLFPPQDTTDTVLTNRSGVNVNVDDTFSLLYCGLYLRQLKETLKHTMLVQETVFKSQVHELHRLYWRQKELMMEMEGTRHNVAMHLDSSFPRTHWMNSSVSTYQTRDFLYEGNFTNRTEAVDNLEKSEKVVLDLELPVIEYDDREVERGLMNGEVCEVSNFLKEQSLESSNQLNKLQLDLNEPAKIEEQHSDNVLSQFPSPVTSNEIVKESDEKNEGRDSVMNEAQGQQSSGGYGIDLNMSPISSEEEVDIVNKFETEIPQECLSVSLHEKHVSKQSRGIVQALPCLDTILLWKKSSKSSVRRSRQRKKVKRGQTKGSQSKQATKGKGSSSSLSKVKSARNRKNIGKRKHCKTNMISSKGHKVVAKKIRKKSKRISLVKEGNYQEISAAEAIVDMSRKFDQESSDCITSLNRNLLWLAEICSLVVEDNELDDFEAMTLQLTEMKLEDHHKTILTSNSSNKTA
ncbi:hypothetical protein EUTSA_v10015619mg, partial [Eutrema salsugineum]